MNYAIVTAWLLGLLTFSGGAYSQGGTPGPEIFQPGDPQRGRLVFARCRTCHYTVAEAGHGNGPNLYRIFGKVAGKQPGFDYYSAPLQWAQFVWTPAVMYDWLENPMTATPGTSMMSAGVPDPGERADLIAYLQRISVLEPESVVAP